MAKWLYTLKLKDLLAQEAGEFDYEAHAVAVAPEAAKRILALAEKAKDADPRKVGNLYDELEEAADIFSSVPNEDDPLETFNIGMEFLYEIGDRWHRVWVS